jgi:5-formyltetrahydrofolate cyclo-ligase
VEKAQAREGIRRRLERLTDAERRTASERIRQHLAALPEFQRARTVLLFAAIDDEVDTWPILADALATGKAVAIPKIDRKRRMVDARELHDLEDGLAPGIFGIMEPQGSEVVPPAAIDLVLVPARGFDRAGNRLGRGGGYYDRYLAQPGLRAVRCGVAFAAQVLDAVPHTALDVPVHLLVTEEGVLRFVTRDA